MKTSSESWKENAAIPVPRRRRESARSEGVHGDTPRGAGLVSRQLEAGRDRAEPEPAADLLSQARVAVRDTAVRLARAHSESGVVARLPRRARRLSPARVGSAGRRRPRRVAL